MMQVYHGSTLCVEYPLAAICRDHLDFGKGFYLTDLKEQAISWAQRVAVINKQEDVCLNVYNLDIETVRLNYKVLTFLTYDDAWLNFVVDNRRGLQSWLDYDMVEGGIANDRVFNTIELYYSGLIAKEEALRRLSYELPNNQLCLLNQSLIDRCLHFVEVVYLKKEGENYVASK